MKEIVYVLTCSCYSGDNSTSVYRNKTHAVEEMRKEIETEITNLQLEDRGYKRFEQGDYTSLYVPDSGIYYDWEITEATLE